MARTAHIPRRGERGAALLIAITAIAILTAVAVDLAYNTRVSLQMAANARDELRATYLAKSAVSMSRLILNFQQRLDLVTKAAASPLPGAQSAQGASAAMPRIALRLWDLVPIDSSAAALFLGAGAGPASAATPVPAAQGPAGGGQGPAAGARRVFGDIEGSFHATIEDEERKINIRQFDGIGTLPAAQTLRLAQLVKDPKWDFLFDEDDANGLRVSRKELFGALKDWEDEDETSSVFTGDPAKPFENGFGDENALYDRMPDRYKAKNAAFDSLDELFMVSGISDAAFAAFGDKLTIYPDPNATINVNTDDPQQLLLNALIMSNPPGMPQPALADPAFIQKLRAALTLVRPLPFMSITALQFANVLQGLGVKVDPIYMSPQGNARSAFGDSSSTFHIRAVGVAGDVHKTIDAVVTFDPRRAGGLAQDLGRLLHWHEE
jgi:general secretion pathway protein K